MTAETGEAIDAAIDQLNNVKRTLKIHIVAEDVGKDEHPRPPKVTLMSE
jgi:hypothetical protein